jgi:hypothetical protein
MEAEQWRGELMRSRLLSLVFGSLVFPAIASAESTLQPKYPPSFDCSAVAAGSQRQACNRSQLNPPMGAIPEVKRTKPETIIQQPPPTKLPTAKPPTIPRLPGTIDNSN